MAEVSNLTNNFAKLDLDQKYVQIIKELPENRKSNYYNPTPSVILPNRLINELEDMLKLSMANDDYNYKNAEFEKFYNEELKSSFEDMLKLREPMLKTSYPQGTFKVANKPRDKNVTDFQLDLPVFQHTDEILKSLEKHTFVLIKGETGSGKTTQIPQMILDYNLNKGSYCRIICTQPRRISAVSIAERVALERKENIGESVGYQIRLEYVPPKHVDSILYCTTGILLRMLVSDPILSNVSHVILDEIHERNIDSDLLIGLIQLVVKYNKNLKVLVMSATFGFEEYSKHFSNFKIINIKGTSYPVKNFYLEDVLNSIKFFKYPNPESYLVRKDPHFAKTPEGRAEIKKVEIFKEMIKKYVENLRHEYPSDILETLRNPYTEDINLELIEKLIDYIDTTMDEGAILVFLPGYDKIINLHEMLYNKVEYGGKSYSVFAVHSMMPNEEQRKIFEKPTKGTRKIILATNIAETSITIDDVVFVINPGKVKVKHYDIKNKVETLEEYWITKANAIQRQGRAGRCQPGICFNLYTRIRAENFEEYPVPEIQRIRMESVIMNLKSIRIHDVKSFLKNLISAPHEETVENGINFLQKLNALDKDEVMTPLGYHLASLPIDPQIGKMLLMATILGCLDPITTVAATLSLKEPFRREIRREREVDKAKVDFSQHSCSDHIAYINVIEEFRKAAKDGNIKNFCEKHYVVRNAVDEIEKLKLQLCELLETTGFTKSPLPEHIDGNISSSEENIITAVITSGLYPNIAILRSVSIKNYKYGDKRVEHIIQTPEDGINVKIHMTSVNRKECEFKNKPKLMVYFIKHKSGKNIFLRESTMTSPISIIMFADYVSIETDELGNYFILVGNNCFRFPSDKRSSTVILKLRQRFERILQQWAMNPKFMTEIVKNDKIVINAVKVLLLHNNV